MLMLSCGDQPLPAEQQIRGLNDAAKTAATARDVSALKDMLAEDYRDQRGNDRQSAVRLVQLYLLRNTSVHLFSVTRSLQLIDEDHAVAEIFVAMAGKPVDSAEQLLDLRADLVRFDVSYVRIDGDWKVSAVEWRRASIDDFI